MFKKLLSVASVGFLAGATVLPISATASEVCVAGECSIEFSHTGSVQIWNVPEGATNLTFEVYGASGGRGGLGGSVTGSLINIPQMLLISVGGAGSVGSNAQGGYNGGGNAGGNRGNEGSGGGASDISTATNLESRIVVAGGGGGGGGYSGAAGAAGGGVTADSGGSGQGAGGGGGTQTSGGSGGASNGGSPSGAGGFGGGGTGGSSWNAGGGGGGGGWYGGGGGGSDDDDCCSDGGGGGGGSSYAASAYTSNVTHLKGVQNGHGKVVLRYTLLPSVTSTSAEQLDAATARFNLAFSQEPVGLELVDFAVTEGCELENLVIDQLAVSIDAVGCPSGEVGLTLLAASVGTDALGPAEDELITLQFDAEGPGASWIGSSFVTSLSTAVLPIDLGDNLNPISTESFEVIGCESLELISDRVAVSVSGCAEGPVEVALRQQVLGDQWANLSPMTPLTFSFTVDISGPALSFSEIQVAGEGPFTYSVVLDTVDAIDFDASLVSFTSSAECLTQSSQINAGWLFEAQCDYSEVQWSITENVVSDGLGNLGPTNPLVATREFSAPVVVPDVVVPAPEPPRYYPPASEPETVYEVVIEPVVPTVSEEISESATTSEPILDTPTESQIITPASLSEQIELIVDELPVVIANSPITQTVVIPTVEEEELPSVESDDVLLEVEPEVEVIEPAAVEVIQVSGPALTPEEDQRNPWLPIGFGILAVAALGVGIWRFSGR